MRPCSREERAQSNSPHILERARCGGCLLFSLGGPTLDKRPNPIYYSDVALRLKGLEHAVSRVRPDAVIGLHLCPARETVTLGKFPLFDLFPVVIGYGTPTCASKGHGIHT